MTNSGAHAAGPCRLGGLVSVSPLCHVSPDLLFSSVPIPVCGVYFYLCPGEMQINEWGWCTLGVEVFSLCVKVQKGNLRN